MPQRMVKVNSPINTQHDLNSVDPISVFFLILLFRLLIRLTLAKYKVNRKALGGMQVRMHDP